MATGTCPNCGTAYGKKARFCRDCGFKFEADSAAEGPERLTESTIDKLDAEAAASEPSAIPESITNSPESPEEDKTDDLFADPAGTPEPSFTVCVISGPDKGKAIPLHPNTTVVLGTGPDTDISLRDECVSRRHAVLQQENGKLFVRDANSTNGTFLSIVDARELTAGDCFVIGSTVIRVAQEG